MMLACCITVVVVIAAINPFTASFMPYRLKLRPSKQANSTHTASTNLKENNYHSTITVLETSTHLLLPSNQYNLQKLETSHQRIT